MDGYFGTYIHSYEYPPPLTLPHPRPPPLSPQDYVACPDCFGGLGGVQVTAIKTISGYVAQIRRLGTGHGVWDLDRALQEAA